MQHEWAALLDAESAYAANKASCRVVGLMRWRVGKAIRMLYMMAEAANWQLTDTLQKYVRDMFQGIPDTKVIEDTHQHLRDLARDNRNFVSSRVKRMFACLTSNVMSKGNIKVIDPPDRQIVAQSWNKCRFMKTRLKTQTKGLTLPDKRMQDIMHPKTPASTTPEGLYDIAAATEWCFKYWQLPPGNDCDLEQAWQTILMQQFDIIFNVASGSAMLVIVPAEYACVTWALAKVHQDGSGCMTWEMQAHHYIMQL